MTRVVSALAMAIALLVTTAPLVAHPLATTTVSIAATDARRLTLVIAADADALIARLEELGGAPVSGVLQTAAGRRARLETLVPTLLQRIDAQVNEVPLAWRLQEVRVDESAQTELRLTSETPDGPRTLTWQSALVYGSYPIAVRNIEGQEVIEWLQGPHVSRPIALDAGHPSSGFFDGLALGFTHIVPAGLDHILFVLGLFLLSRRPREVLLQVTTFTVAHSITLGLSLYGLVSIPPSIVEPMIALSVAYVGVENLMTSRLHPSRVAIVFAFGLLHGMGFAEALTGLHLSPFRFLMTLVSFNLGVEAGQLAVIAVAAAALAGVMRVRASARAPAVRFASAAIGVAGTVWTIQRLVGG
jgi:hydrogenase/urease accessory protein HupE